MAWEPSLGAFYGPVSFILLVTCVYFLCAFIQLRKHPERRYELQSLREETQRLADTHTHPAETAGDSGQCHGGCPGLINPSTLANEHSFKAQLRTAAFTLFLFTSTWTFGALAVSQAHFLDMIFSCLYGAFSVTLGLFVLIHHCAKRDDVWHCWCACCPGRRAKPQHARIKKINANGDTHTHMHADAPKSILSHSHCACRCAQTPVSPCCGAIHTQQILEDDEAPHVLLHADPQGYRMHRCIKPPIRTKTRRRERELSFHIPESVHGSPHTHICHHVCHHEALALCHHHVCCADEELSCAPDAGEVCVCVCGKPVQEDLHHVELQARRQSVPSQNGILKASAMYASDSTGNIRTGPWRNETTV